jgi:hypothetical protein
MIKKTKLTFSAEDSKIMVRLLDASYRETHKNLEDRSDSFKYMSDADIKRYEDFYHEFYSSTICQMTMSHLSTDEY